MYVPQCKQQRWLFISYRKSHCKYTTLNTPTILMPLFFQFLCSTRSKSFFQIGWRNAMQYDEHKMGPPLDPQRIQHNKCTVVRQVFPQNRPKSAIGQSNEKYVICFCFNTSITLSRANMLCYVLGGWLTWRGLFFKWTPIGVCIIAAVQWYLVGGNDSDNEPPRTASTWQSKVYCSLPLRLLSRGFGWMADCRIPTPFRPIIYGGYSTAFGVNLDEAASSDFK